MARLKDLKRFYSLMDRLENLTGGKRKLESCDRFVDPRDSGVYFFFEKGERRQGSGTGRRVVRVGKCVRYRQRISREHKPPTMDEEARFPNILWGSVFRVWVLHTLFRKHFAEHEQYEDIAPVVGGRVTAMRGNLNKREQRLLAQLSREYMWPMSFLFLPIEGEEQRRYIERNSIGLLSEYREERPIDLASRHWLGRHCVKERIRKSGLWNSNHVGRRNRPKYEPAFLDLLEELVDRAGDRT